MADSNAARRRARRRVGSTGATGVRRTLIVTGACVAAATLALLPLSTATDADGPVHDFRDVLFGTENATDPEAASDAGASSSTSMLRSVDPEGGAEGVVLSIAPTLASTFTLGTAETPVTIMVELENRSGGSVAAGEVRLVRASSSIDDDAELDAWLAAPSTGSGFGSSSIVLGEAASRPVAAGGTTQVAFTVPSSAFADIAGSPVIGIGAELVSGETVTSTGTASFANTAVPSTGTPLAMVAPITVPASSSGLIASEDLEAWTSATGLLTRQLDALDGRQIAIGIDPRIIASIRALGTSAPPSATEWLGRLAAVPNETFPLAYADADLALQAQIGLSAPLLPTSFADVLDPDLFVADPTTEQGTGQDDAEAAAAEPTDPTATPTAPPTDGAPTVPSTEELLSWSYTRTDIAWPGDTTVSTGNLSFFNAAGLTTTVLDASNVAPLAGARASALVDGGTAIVSDAEITEAIRAGSMAETDLELRDAAGEVLARAALDADPSSASAPLLATFGRQDGQVSDRLGDLVDEIATNQFVTLTGLAQAIGAPPTPRTLVDSSEAESRRALASDMVSVETEVDEFATVLDEPTDLTGPVRRDLLALLDVGWLDRSTEWSSASFDWLAAQHDVVDSISVVPSSTVLVVASETGIPITVQNASVFPVTVEVVVEPSNGRLVVDEPVQVTVEPESRNTVSVPVAAGVGNGEVRLAVSLRSVTGVSVGSTVVITADVRADWEGLGATFLAGVLVLVFGIGLWRNIRRRRRARAADASTAKGASTDADPIVPADETSDEPTHQPGDEPAAEPSGEAAATEADAETHAGAPAPSAGTAAVDPSEPTETSERRDD
ncbi:hypothetical protein SAMN05428970_0185 [Agromyces sp. CF514]|uniref:DUF6049 family protein n=1 Tax=Agromyces sp. CF514 TaxID=1881031 RepID=UPI0008EB1D0F|nr:DUF6049 family protein [Agromyces sp. CF514]SFR67295.1 hypothetical protein SAMN05428970_0185 [Agromyces sp. CF514]